MFYPGSKPSDKANPAAKAVLKGVGVCWQANSSLFVDRLSYSEIFMTRFTPSGPANFALRLPSTARRPSSYLGHPSTLASRSLMSLALTTIRSSFTPWTLRVRWRRSRRTTLWSSLWTWKRTRDRLRWLWRSCMTWTLSRSTLWSGMRKIASSGPWYFCLRACMCLNVSLSDRIITDPMALRRLLRGWLLTWMLWTLRPPSWQLSEGKVKVSLGLGGS